MNTNKQAYLRWASTHTLTNITFWWKDGTGSSECRLHDKTYNEASKVAKQFGFVEPRWYKPWTWGNGHWVWVEEVEEE